MNFYKHYIGDFQRDTGHLSLTERGAYLCLIHHYYATEKPLPNDHAALCRIAGAIDKAERKAVLAVMAFFSPVDSGLMHKRIEAEIEKAGKQADTNRQIAIEREARRKAERDADEQSTNRATNREPHQTPDTRQIHSEAKASGGKPPQMTPEEIIFGYGVPLLVSAGSTDKAARSFLGGLRKAAGDDGPVVNALRDCIRAKPLQPLEWLAKAIPPASVGGKQTALERRNAAVVAELGGMNA